MTTVFTLLQGAFLLAFGVILSAAFTDLRFTRQNTLSLLVFYCFSGILQIGTMIIWDDQAGWLAYPLITHLPLILYLHVFYRKRFATALVSVLTAYLCCQPSKWFGVLVSYFFPVPPAEYLVRWIVLIVVAVIMLKYTAPYLSQIYNKDSRSVLIFGTIPITYYVFDYAVSIYTDLWIENNRIVAEFLPFFLCVAFFAFCFVYYREYEQKADAQRKEQIIQLAVEQQTREMEAVKRKEHEIRLLRHDMRMLLSSLALCVEEGDKDAALKMIHNYTDSVDATAIQRYCSSSILNYVIADYASRYEKEGIPFDSVIEVDSIDIDETILCSILSNALDNAFHAQQLLPTGERSIQLTMRKQNGKLLISLANPVLEPPIFVDGLPVTTQKGHGYGIQSIRYMVERLRGTCQFTMKDQIFVFRAIL